MKILLTNDDGIHAPGIEAMHEALDGLGEVMTVAPLTVQSATGHGITFDQPLMCTEVAVNDRMTGHAVDGRPADCVKVALRALWQKRYGEGTAPDLVVSGMNSGANIGINVIYSGTVAAAVEAAFLGVPAIAVSLHIGNPAATRYTRAAQIARSIIDRVLEYPIEPHSVINVNVPRTEADDRPMPPIHVVDMNLAAGSSSYECRQSPDGRDYYWACGSGIKFDRTANGSDVEALLAGNATVTPLDYDLTDHARITTWRERLDTR
ncbi:MAG: 5'/3'-nucleotidase SurE [Planctomycetota bacterium]|nr:5'/3'-nucleotidase SurE [Planctomycetota bacterium]